MRQWIVRIVLGSVICTAMIWLALELHAVPSFARKYGTSCARCHSVFPRLTRYGENFRLRGYQTPGEAGAGMMDIGDEQLDLLQALPLSLRMGTSVAFTEQESLQFADPRGTLFAASTLTQDVGFFAELEPELNKWNLVFADLTRNPREPTELNAVVGKFIPLDWGLAGSRSLTVSPYSIYRVDLGGGALDHPQVGLMLYGTVGSGIGAEVVTEETAEREAAVEEVTAAERAALEREFEMGGEATATEAVSEAVPLSHTSYDMRKGFRWQAGVVNGAPPPAGGAHRHKNIFARIAYAHRNQRVGLFGYWGQSTRAGPAGPVANSFRRLAVDLTLDEGKTLNIGDSPVSQWSLLGFAAWGWDRNPLATTTPTEVKHWGGFLEANYLIDDRRVAVLRHDWVHSAEAPSLNRRFITAHYSYYVRRNWRLSLEGRADLRSGEESSFTLALDTAF